MRRKLLLVSVAVASTLAALGQTSAQPPTAALPDSTFFKFFFIHVARLQAAADALRAKGKNDLSMRNLIQSEARLTDLEFATVVNVAASCNSAYAAASKSGMAEASQIGQQYSTPSALPPAALQQINALEAQRVQIIASCMASLQSQMGQARYQTLRNFVVLSEAPNIMPRALNPAAGPPGTTPPQN